MVEWIEAICWLVLGVVVGIPIGQSIANGDWTAHGDAGFPRIYNRGRLYWVNRDDKPCFRCAPWVMAAADRARARKAGK